MPHARLRYFPGRSAVNSEPWPTSTSVPVPGLGSARPKDYGSKREGANGVAVVRTDTRPITRPAAPIPSSTRRNSSYGHPPPHAFLCFVQTMQKRPSPPHRKRWPTRQTSAQNRRNSPNSAQPDPISSSATSATGQQQDDSIHHIAAQAQQCPVSVGSSLAESLTR
jgi:hypothetical protein